VQLIEHVDCDRSLPLEFRPESRLIVVDDAEPERTGPAVAIRLLADVSNWYVPL
jgi:hypothetical protein